MLVSEYIAAIVKPMLNHPDSFSVNQKVDEMGVLLIVDIDTSDLGLLIGKHGETAKAVRHLVRVVGMANKQRVSVKINEPNRVYKHKQF